MKNLNIFLLLACMLMFSQAYGQFGVKLGANMSAAGSYGNSEEGEVANLKTGYQAGVFYQLAITDGFALMAEVNYEARGTVSKKDYTIGLPIVDPGSGTVLGMGEYVVSQEINSRQNYLNIPILAVLGEGNFKYYIGPNIGLFLNGTAEFERTIDVFLEGNQVNKIESSIDDVDWKDYESFKGIFTDPIPEEDGDFINSLEIGVNIGAMYYLTDNLFVDLRVNQGLMDVTNNSYDKSIYPAADFTFPSREDTDRNFSVQLSVGFGF